jgi:hypothetical protein
MKKGGIKMAGYYEVEHAALKAIGFSGFIKATLECIENGSLTIVVQDNHAIQINRCEKYKLEEYIEEINSLGGEFKV